MPAPGHVSVKRPYDPVGTGPSPAVGQPSVESETGRVHQNKEYINSTPTRCRRPQPGRDWRTGLPKMVECGRPKCSRECRDKWARKHARCAALSFRTLLPTHHLVIRPKGAVSPAVLATSLGKVLIKLKRLLDGDLEYVRIFEWRNGWVHTHVWLRTQHKLTSRQAGTVCRDVLPFPFEYSCTPRWGEGEAVARYFFKDVTKRAKKAELPPPEFRGKLFVASRRFFVRPIAALWKEVRAEWAPPPAL